MAPSVISNANKVHLRGICLPNLRLHFQFLTLGGFGLQTYFWVVEQSAGGRIAENVVRPRAEAHGRKGKVSFKDAVESDESGHSDCADQATE